MKTILSILLLLFLANHSYASKNLPPDFILNMAIEELQRRPDKHDHWSIDYGRIEQHNKDLTREKVNSTLRSINVEKIVLADHERYAEILEMIHPIHIILHYEKIDREGTKGPRTTYRLIRIEKIESNEQK